MGEKRNFAALEWVMGEISDTLTEARQSLEAYVEDPKDSTRIRFCLTHIHQVHGSLQMVEFHGAALLAEEMEQAAQAIMDNQVASLPEAQEVLMRSLLQLPILLDHIKSTKEDNPVRVMPLLNDLRAVRKQSYLSETNLFSPDLSSIGEASGPRHEVLSNPEKLAQVVKKLREMYQFAAASVLRGIKVEENLNYLDKVFSRLELISSGTPAYPTWEVSAALADALRRDEVELTVAVRGLLRYIARELRLLGDNTLSALETKPRESLLKNLLYYVARAEDGSEKVAAVKAKYALKSALLHADESTEESAKDVLQAPDASAIRSVVVALQDEIGSIKHVLDVTLSGQGSTDEIKEVLPVVKRVADTLAVLGIGDLRKQMLAQSETLEKISEANSVDEQELMRAASGIIEIEHRLQAISKSAGKHSDLATVDEREVEIDNAKAAVIKECAAGLQKSKEAIIDYISSQWDKQYLNDVSALLTDIRGGLNMIPLPRPAAIVDSCAAYIQENLIETDSHPSFQSLESLADAMSSVEYHLERLMEDLNEGSDSTLDIAEESVANLGYRIVEVETSHDQDEQDEHAVGETQGLPLAETDSETETEGSVDAELETEAGSFEYDVADSADDAPDIPVVDYSADTLETEALADTTNFAEALISAEDEVEDEIESADLDVHSEEQAGAGESSVEDAQEELQEDAQPVQTPAAASPEPLREPEEPESDIDDEIIEIFIEEAGEVLETLNEYYPLWRERESDQDSLVVVRRAFHTLKGSGRMVEAFDIGELAWSVENMLNRVIDRTIRVEPPLFHLIDAVIDVIPTLVDAFEKRQANPIKDLTSQYETWGHEISEGNYPEALNDPLPAYTPGEAAKAADEKEDTALPSQESVADTTEVDDDDGVDRVLQEIFSQESTTHIETLDGFIRHMESEAPIYGTPTDALQRALHTLKGSAKMAQVWPIAEIAEPLEHFTKELITFQVNVDGDIVQLLRDASEYTRDAIRQIDANEAVEIPKTEQFVARTQELRDLAVGHFDSLRGADTGEHKVDPRMLSLVMAEEMALLLRADTLLGRCQQDPVPCEDDIRALIAELAVLEEGANHANLLDMSQLSANLRSAHQLALDGKLNTDDHYYRTMHEGHEALLDMVDAVAAGQNVVSPPAELNETLLALIATQEEPETDDAAEQGSEEIEFLSTDEDTFVETLADEEIIVDFAAEEELESHEADESETTEIEAFLAEENLDDSDSMVVADADADESALTEDEISFDFSEETEDGEITFEAIDDDEEISFDVGDLASETELSVDTERLGEATVSLGDDDESAAEEELPLISLDDGDDLAASAVSDIDDHIGALGEEKEAEESASESGDELELETQSDETASFSAELGGFEFGGLDSDESITFDTDTETSEVEALDAEDELAPSFSVEDSEDLGDDSAEESTHATESKTEPEIEVEVQEEGALRIIQVPGLIDRIDIHSPDFDSDILEVFLEEADELVEGLDEAIHTWESNWSDSESVEEIKRILHTLKGGARLSGLNNLGDLTHDYETMLIEMGDDLSAVDNAFFGKIHGYQDKILGTVRGVRVFLSGDYDIAEIGAVVEHEKSADKPQPQVEEAADKASEPPKAVPAPSSDEGDASNIFKFQPKPRPPSSVEPPEFVMPTVSSGATASAGVALKKAGPQEVVKVSAELLEELVNLAGETSINRSRLEQYVNDFGHALDEVDSTLSRLQDQLRRLDIETEAQILFRQEQMEAHDEFDPLEMDRYSHLQQLSRSLIESASDLTDLKIDLGDKLKVTETLLIQQSRINTTLQEGLMRSRMVPFSRMVPRLRRIVRQVAGELGKNVSFELDNVEGELDRSVLERMVPPFEHMLRNAVDHGIESPEDRIESGKSEAGRIVLTLAREGGDVIIRLADDGRGINLKRVREKAIERELMSADAELSDHDIMQFILHAGFSTAETVSQISGRGVGMDVVNAEIKQLGGSVTINSAWGKGTEFVVRLPFTLSVNRALMVAIGQDHYAVPLSSIEGIVRVSPFELEHYYANPEAQFEYANENYHVRYLGSLLARGAQANLEGQVLPMPVLLVRSAEHTMALQVDAVMGSREIVVKSLGPQFSTVAGLSGATVMGDGSVVVILDPHALVRQEIAQASLLLENEDVELLVNEAEESRVKQVMVVDDSVTVRKVTTRFLEREGFEVVTAKDGVDALRLLQEGIPDLMLLDIEMPRMDGFEVAKTVRTTQRWENLPIIMITSRTGDKHREHALSLGVNNYLGKPYQEDILLEAIGEILDTKALQH